MICVAIIQQFADLFGTFPRKIQYYLSPFQNFLTEWKVSNEFGFPTFFVDLTICLVCNRIFNFRRGKGSKKSHISVSYVEQSHATSLFPITGSSSTRRASKLYKYFGLKGLSHSLSLFSCFTSITFYLISLRF